MAEAPARMPLAAIVHSGEAGIDSLVTALAHALRAAGYRVGGVAQSNVDIPGECRCDMSLEELTSGRVIPISQDLGSQSEGCRLDPSALETMVGLVDASLAGGLDILVLNKFGKQEADGRGLRDTIAKAVAAGIPVLVALNAALIPAWDEFSGGEGVTLKPDRAEIERWLKASLPDMRT
ncbi:MAG: DUF2478 domain-containing protein [Hyphomicrobiales bacterium]|nr:DUF2478 domain-containing protein [Hyphomicrobiales bacterium]